MAVAIASLAASFSCFHVGQIQNQAKPLNKSFLGSPLRAYNLKAHKKPNGLHLNGAPTIRMTAATTPAPSDLEKQDLPKYVKSRLPGGFAAQKLIATGRRKTAVARVVLLEGSGKVIINGRTAQVPFSLQTLVVIGFLGNGYIYIYIHINEIGIIRGLVILLFFCESRGELIVSSILHTFLKVLLSLGNTPCKMHVMKNNISVGNTPCKMHVMKNDILRRLPERQSRSNTHCHHIFHSSHFCTGAFPA